MSTGITLQQVVFFVILIIAFGLLLTERLRNDMVAVLIILALAITRVLSPDDALSGFSSEPAIVVASIFVLSKALEQTGVAEKLGAWIGRLAGRTYSRAIAIIMPAVALLSAFTHHVTITAVMLPITLNFSRERDISPSKLLMPLSFAASLGTTITIIGAPAFLVASDTLRHFGRPGLNIFSVAPIGLALTVVGTLYILTIGRLLLPNHEGGGDVATRFQFDKYLTEVSILENSELIGKTLADIKTDNRFDFIPIGWVRNGKPMARPFRDYRLEAGDVLRVYATPADLIVSRQEVGIELHPIEKFGEGTPSQPREEVADELVQAVIAPGSDLIGRSLQQIDFRQRFGAIVVGLWRRRGFIREGLANAKLRAGDVLVLQGDEANLNAIEKNPSFLMLMPFQGEAKFRRKASLAILITLAVIVLAGFNLLTLDIAMLFGAVMVVLLGCITPRQAYQSIDTRIYVFIAGAIPLGIAMEKSGASAMVAHWLQGAIGGWSEIAILLVIFAITGIITQFMSDAATTALFAPVAAALAQALGHAPEPYVITVAMASIVAFITPIGHHGNLLVYGPGRYQFRDFVRVGTPLTILAALVVVVMSMMLWPK